MLQSQKQALGTLEGLVNLVKQQQKNMLLQNKNKKYLQIRLKTDLSSIVWSCTSQVMIIEAFTRLDLFFLIMHECASLKQIRTFNWRRFLIM